MASDISMYSASTDPRLHTITMSPRSRKSSLDECLERIAVFEGAAAFEVTDLTFSDPDAELAQLLHDEEMARNLATGPDSSIIDLTDVAKLAYTHSTDEEELMEVRDSDILSMAEVAASVVPSVLSVLATRVYMPVRHGHITEQSYPIGAPEYFSYNDGTVIDVEALSTSVSKRFRRDKPPAAEKRFVQFDVKVEDYVMCLHCRMEQLHSPTGEAYWEVKSARVTPARASPIQPAMYESAVISIADLLCQLCIYEDASDLLKQLHTSSSTSLFETRISKSETRTVEKQSAEEIQADVDETLKAVLITKDALPSLPLCHLLAMLHMAVMDYQRICYVCARVHPEETVTDLPRTCDSYACKESSICFVQHFDVRSQLCENNWTKAHAFQFFLASAADAAADAVRRADLLQPVPIAYMTGGPAPDHAMGSRAPASGPRTLVHAHSDKFIDWDRLVHDLHALQSHITVQQLLSCENDREVRGLHVQAQLNVAGVPHAAMAAAVRAVKENPDALFNPTNPVFQATPAEDAIAQKALSLSLLSESLEAHEARSSVIASLVPAGAEDIDRLYRLTWWLLQRIPSTLRIADPKSLPKDFAVAVQSIIARNPLASHAPAVHPSPAFPNPFAPPAPVAPPTSSGSVTVIKFPDADIKATVPTQNVYHGSGLGNWLSIANNGIKLLSNTRHMVNGAAFGTGIYLGPQFATARAYSQSKARPLLLAASGRAYTASAPVAASPAAPNMHAVAMCRATTASLKTVGSGLVCDAEENLSLDYIAVINSDATPLVIPARATRSYM